jgi:hypothetical protein
MTEKRRDTWTKATITKNQKELEIAMSINNEWIQTAVKQNLIRIPNTKTQVFEFKTKRIESQADYALA